MMLEKLNSFWEKNILPTLLATSQDDAMDEQQSGDKEIFCKCQQQKDDNMVGSDNQECKFKWFHYSCVGLKSGPRKSLWYCSQKCKNAVKNQK